MLLRSAAPLFCINSLIKLLFPLTFYTLNSLFYHEKYFWLSAYVFFFPLLEWNHIVAFNCVSHLVFIFLRKSTSDWAFFFLFLLRLCSVSLYATATTNFLNLSSFPHKVVFLLWMKLLVTIAIIHVYIWFLVPIESTPDSAFLLLHWWIYCPHQLSTPFFSLCKESTLVYTQPITHSKPEY